MMEGNLSSAHSVIQKLHFAGKDEEVSPPKAHHHSGGGEEGHANMSSAQSTTALTLALASENKNALWLAKRPLLKAFLHHVIMLLGLLPFADYDSYVRELQATIEDCLGTQRYKRAAAAAHYVQQHRKHVIHKERESSSVDTGSHNSMYSSMAEIEDRSAADGGKFFWEEEHLRPDDAQLSVLLHELSTQTCHLPSALQIEAKLGRLIEAYFSLRVRTHRVSITSVIGHGHMSDPQRCLHFLDLFALNFFSSDTHPSAQALNASLNEQTAIGTAATTAVSSAASTHRPPATSSFSTRQGQRNSISSSLGSSSGSSSGATAGGMNGGSQRSYLSTAGGMPPSRSGRHHSTRLYSSPSQVLRKSQSLDPQNPGSGGDMLYLTPFQQHQQRQREGRAHLVLQKPLY